MAEEGTKTLKGGEFLIRDSAPAETFIPEELDEEARMMAGVAEEFVEKEVFPKLEDIDKQEPGLVQGLLDKAGEIGLLGTAIPEEYGGLGKDFNTNTAITVALGPSHAFGVSIAAHTGIGTLPILYYGTEEQKQKYLPKLLNGELKAAYCLTEPGSGSDALAAKTKAELADDGQHYILNGQKMWITNGGFADVFTVFAQVIEGGEQKFSAFIVDGDSPGVSRGAEERKMGIKGSSTTQIFFEGVKVPKENLLGEIGKGHKIAFNILNIGRFKLCAMVVGGAIRSSSLSVQYANERHQFGKPIASFGAIQHKLAEQAIQIYACESATYRVSDFINRKIEDLKSEGKTYGDAQMAAAEEYALECAMLKVFGSEIMHWIADEMVQIYGGYGYSEEFPAARAFRDQRINRIFEGTNEINRLLTVDMLVRKAMKGQLDVLTPAMAVQKELMSIPEFGDEEEGVLSAETKAIKNAKKAILMVAGAAVQKMMQKLEEEQEIVMNVADMMIQTFVAESVLLRTKKLIQTKGEEEAKPYIQMTQVFIHDALMKMNISARNAVEAFASGDELRMMNLGIKRFTKSEPLNTKQLRRDIAGRLIEANKYCF